MLPLVLGVNKIKGTYLGKRKVNSCYEIYNEIKILCAKVILDSKGVLKVNFYNFLSDTELIQVFEKVVRPFCEERKLSLIQWRLDEAENSFINIVEWYKESWMDTRLNNTVIKNAFTIGDNLYQMESATILKSLQASSSSIAVFDSDHNAMRWLMESK